MAVKGGYLLLAGGGAVLIWSGLRGKRWSDVIRGFISGTPPAKTATTLAIQGGVITGGMAGGENAAAQDALQYQGAGYVWGGAPGNGAGNWDCSSFANAVFGRDLSLPIPGFPPGGYRGQSHGPTTVIWLVWQGATSIPRAQARPGDLAIWQTHMGIIIDNGVNMISALNPSLGTRITTIDGGGPPLEVLKVRRLK